MATATWFLTGALSALLALTGCASAPVPAPEAARSAPAEGAAPGDAPAFRIHTAEGKAIDSAEVLGKRPVVLVFFMSWCPVCAKDVTTVRPALERATAEGAEVLAVALDEDDSWADVAPFVKEHGLRAPVVRGHREAAFVQAYDPGAKFPLVVVVDKAGQVKLRQHGAPSDGEAQVTAALASLR